MLPRYTSWLYILHMSRLNNHNYYVILLVLLFEFRSEALL
jgi:hypothetical protein